MRDIVSPSTRIPVHNAPRCCESVVADFVAKSRKGLLATPILLPTLTPSEPRRGGERETTAYLVASLHFTRSRSRYFSSFRSILRPSNLSSLESFLLRKNALLLPGLRFIFRFHPFRVIVQLKLIFNDLEKYFNTEFFL